MTQLCTLSRQTGKNNTIIFPSHEYNNKESFKIYSSFYNENMQLGFELNPNKQFPQQEYF